MTSAPRMESQLRRRSSSPPAQKTSLHVMMASVLTWKKGTSLPNYEACFAPILLFISSIC